MEAHAIERSLDLLALNCDRLSEELFLQKFRDFAASDSVTVTAWLSNRLLEESGSRVLQVRLLGVISSLQLTAATRAVERFLARDLPARVFRQAVRCLRLLATRESYHLLRSMLQSPALPSESQAVVSEEFAELLAGSRLLFSFDIFARPRSDAKRIEPAADFLIEQAPDDWLADLVSVAVGAPDPLRLQALRILGSRPLPGALSILLHPLQPESGALSLSGALFRAHVKALVCQATTRLQQREVAARLEAIAPGLQPAERTILEIQLVRLDPRRYLPPLMPRYSGLTTEDRLALLAVLPVRDPGGCTPFLRGLLAQEDRPPLLTEVVRILLLWGDVSFLFQTLAAERPFRRRALLEMVFAADPDGIAPHVADLLQPTEEDAVLGPALSYLFQREPAGLAGRVVGLFTANVSPGIKQLIVRRLRDLPPADLQHFLERVLTDRTAIAPFVDDLLACLQPLLAESRLPEVFAEWLFNQLLVLMEETSPAQLGPFVRFFECYRPRSRREADLLAAELKLAHQLLLRSGGENQLSQRIHRLTGKLGGLRF